MICSRPLTQQDKIRMTTCGHLFHDTCLNTMATRRRFTSSHLPRECLACGQTYDPLAVRRMFLNSSEPTGRTADVNELKAEIEANKVHVDRLCDDAQRLKAEFVREKATEFQLQLRIKVLNLQLNSRTQRLEQCLRNCQQLDPCQYAVARETAIESALVDMRERGNRPEKARAKLLLLEAESDVAETMHMGASRRQLGEMVIARKRQLQATVVVEKSTRRELSAHLQHNDDLQQRVIEVLQPQVLELKEHLDATMHRGRRNRPMATTDSSAEMMRRNSFGAMRTTQAKRTPTPNTKSTASGPSGGAKLVKRHSVSATGVWRN